MFEGFLAPSHLMIIAIAALLLFGDRLPEVMRSVGKGVAEFKKGLRGIESAIESASTASPTTSSPTATSQSNLASTETAARRSEISAPRFDPPTGEPRAESGAAFADTQAPPAPHPVVEGSHHETEAYEG
jgi:sec-independent protein translocase protein TatA